MSTVEATTPTPIRTSARIPAGIKGAIIAARATGLSQKDIAQRFSVHPNTVQRVCAQVAEANHPSNPLSKDWKSSVRTAAQEAAMALITQRKDVVSAGNAGIKVLYGLGDLSNSSKVEVEGNVSVTFAWAQVQPDPVYDDVSTQSDCVDAQYTALSDGKDSDTPT